MSHSNTMMKQGSKPTGLLGKLIGSMMNRHHSRIYHWALELVDLTGTLTTLDIGCGGGKAVQLLAARMPQSTVHGLDHSPEMVQLASHVNTKAIKKDRVQVHHGSVSSLPFEDDQLDLVTAFETIQFWSTLAQDLREIHRVLKPGGTLLIANRYPNLEGKDAAWKDVLQVHSVDHYRELLTQAGFENMQPDTASRPGWIRLTAQKPA